jgi:hypothetical protein
MHCHLRLLSSGSVHIQYQLLTANTHTYYIYTILRGLSPQANYTDQAIAAVGEVVPTFAGRGVLRGQRNGFPRLLISVF